MGKISDILNKGARFFIGYFCAVTVTAQTLVNNIALFCPKYYSETVDFWCANLLGVNGLTAILMVAMCQRFHLCRWSWACAVCEVVFVLTNLFITDNFAYNLIIQIVSGTASILLSIYVKYIVWKRQKSLS